MVQEVKGRWKLYLNRGDFDLKIPLPLIKKILFTPVVGATFGSINQSFHVRYTNYLIQFPDDNTPQQVNNQSSFIGCGPKNWDRYRLYFPMGFYEHICKWEYCWIVRFI